MKSKKTIKVILFTITAFIVGFVLLIVGFLAGESVRNSEFALLNQNLIISTQQISTKNESIYQDFDFMYRFIPEQVGVQHRQAQIVRERTHNILANIQRIGDNMDRNEMANLQIQLNNHTDFLLDVISDVLYRYGEEWNRYRLSFFNVEFFSNLSPTAFITALSKIQLDVLRNETEVLKHLMWRIGANDKRVNRLGIISVPKSSNIRLGETYSTQIFLTAVDTTNLPRVYIDGKLLDGMTYEVTPTRTGTFTYEGWMEVMAPDGLWVFPFRNSFTVR